MTRDREENRQRCKNASSNRYWGSRRLLQGRASFPRGRVPLRGGEATGETTKRTTKGSVIIPLALLWDQTRRSRQTRQLEWIFEIPGGAYFLRSSAEIIEQYRSSRYRVAIFHINYVFEKIFALYSGTKLKFLPRLSSLCLFYREYLKQPQC